MLSKTKAIVLSKIKVSDHKEILKCFSEEDGILSLLFFNKSTKKSSQRTNFQIFQEVEFVFQKIKEAQLPIVKEFTIVRARLSLLDNPINSLIGMFMAELLSACIGEHERNDLLFHFMEELGGDLDTNDIKTNELLLWYMLHLSQILGFRPAAINVELDSRAIYFDPLQGSFDVPQSTSLPKEESLLLNSLLHSYENELPMQVEKDKRIKTIQLLLNYFQLHVPNLRVPRSLDVVIDVLYN